MSAHIDQTYSRATSEFKTIMAEKLGISTDEVQRKRVPPLKKAHPVSGKPVTIRWEPEDSLCFENAKDLYQFPRLIQNSGDITLLPDLGLNFQTATLAYIPKKEGTNLDRYMIRQRFDFATNPQAIAEWDKRIISEITFGIKDSGKAPDRMEMEARRTSLKLRQSINALKRDHKKDIEQHQALYGLTPSQLRTGAITAMSRASFFGIHFDPKTGIGVDYQFSVDYCRNSRPTLKNEKGQIIVDGLRLEGEGEAFGTYSDRKLGSEERIKAIQSSLYHIFTSVEVATAQQDIVTIPTDKNKAEFARGQVSKAYGLDRTRKDNVKAEDYARQPLRRRLIQLFDGSAANDLPAMPTPAELRILSGLSKPHAEAFTHG